MIMLSMEIVKLRRGVGFFGRKIMSSVFEQVEFEMSLAYLV